MTEHRCSNCKGLLLKGDMVQCDIVCHKCKTMNHISYLSQKHLWLDNPTTTPYDTDVAQMSPDAPERHSKAAAK